MKPVKLQLRLLIRETLSDLSSDGESFDQYSVFMRDVKQGQAKIFVLSSPLTLVHRSNNMDLTLNDLDPLAIRQTKQGKRNSPPKVGLYAYSIEHDVPRYGDNKLTIVMPSGSKVLDLTKLPRGKSSRIDIDTAHKLVKDGIDLITGFDLIGPQEWVILKKPTSLVKEAIEDLSYKGEHESPDKRDAPLHDLTTNGVYPKDVYTHRHYYESDSSESDSWAIVTLAKGKPNYPVKIYRAVPKTLSQQEELDAVRFEKKYILKYGRLPPGAESEKNRHEYYDDLCQKEEKLELSIQNAPQTSKIMKINSGDWVTIDRAYAVEHGESNLGGKGRYRIISKTVPAKHIFTDGNSIIEWGYSP